MRNLILVVLIVVGFNQIIMAQPDRKYGILGQQAPELQVNQWIDGSGEPTDTIKLSDYENKVVVILAFQSWCPGCHSIGFPTIRELSNHYEGNDDVVFLVIQTPFEGQTTNTYEKLAPTQKDYKLKIPFGQDSEVGEKGMPSLMEDYKTGGTPWTIIMDKDHKVIFNNFNVPSTYAIKLIDNNLK